METLVNAIESVLANSAFLEDCRGLVKRGLGILDKRNAMLHDVWGIDEKDRSKIMLATFPKGSKRPLELKTLTGIVHDLRVLADEVAATRTFLDYRPHYQISVTHKIADLKAATE
jgi:hypothetical protein